MPSTLPRLFYPAVTFAHAVVALVAAGLAAPGRPSTDAVIAPNLAAVSAQFRVWENGGAIDVVFMDLDETVIYPVAPFIYGLPWTDSFLGQMRRHCSAAQWNQISAEMERLYYASAHVLVEESMVTYLKTAASIGHVVALTARTLRDSHTAALLDDLLRFGVTFSDPWVVGTLPSTQAEVLNVTVDGYRIGGIIFASEVDKGDIILDYIQHRPAHIVAGLPLKAALVDNLLVNCERAAATIANASSGVDFLAVHYTAAYRLAPPTEDLQRSAARIKASVGIPASDCPIPQEQMSLQMPRGQVTGPGRAFELGPTSIATPLAALVMSSCSLGMLCGARCKGNRVRTRLLEHV